MEQLAAKFPTRRGLPFIGSAHEVLTRDHNKLLELVYKESFNPKYENFGSGWFGHRLIIAIVNPKDIEVFLSSSELITKSEEYNYFEPWFGNGILISNGKMWKHQRKLIAPTFHLNVLKRFMNEFNENSQKVIERMRKNLGKQIDCHDYMSEIMVETLLETVMGVKLEDQGKKCSTYATSVLRMCDIIHTRQIKLWLRGDFIFKWTKMAKEFDKNLNIILNMTNSVFKKKKEEILKKISEYAKVNEKIEIEEVKEETVIESNPNGNFSYGQASGIIDDLDDDNAIGEKKRLPFLESLIERSHNGDGLSEEDVKNQINTIMFEGHDTTAAASSFFLCIMADRQDIQAKCVEELDTIFGNSNRPVTFQDTLEMKYLERCIMETLRLFPPVPVIARQTLQDVKMASEDLTIPSGTTVLLVLFKVHRRPEIYPDPEKYDPDRFLPENSAGRHFYSFVPFSAGPRGCVGRKYAMLKLKILLANILRNFHVKDGKPMKDWKLQGDIILKRSDGFNITLEPRKRV